MDEPSTHKRSGLAETQRPAIRFLVESALQTVISNTAKTEPRTRAEWIDRLCEALMSDADSSYQSVVASLVASGLGSDAGIVDRAQVEAEMARWRA